MGFGQVLAQIAGFKQLLQEILAAIDRESPALVILVDYPGLHVRLAEQLSLRRIPVIQYVAPKVWAWGQSRVEKIRRYYSLVLGMLPFEEEFFRRHQVAYRYIGSPLRDRADIICARLEAQLPRERAKHGCGHYTTLLGFLPGSRVEEVRYILPILAHLNAEIKKHFPQLGWVVPIAENLDEAVVRKYLPPGLRREEGGNVHLVRGNSLELMRMSDACVVASGTATLECALLEIPLVAVYRMNELNYQIARRVVKVSWISLVNLVLEKAAIVEFVQDFSLQDVVAELSLLLKDTKRRSALGEDYSRLRELLGAGAADQAARQVLLTLEKTR
jgi:lipid-A-disaccharide synthase